MADDDDSCVVILVIGAVIVVAILMVAWALVGGVRAPTTTDNCPAEYKDK